MRVIIAGSRNLNDYSLVCEAIEKSGFVIDEIVSGNCKGCDMLGERYAKEHGIAVKLFPAKWNDLHQKGAIIKTRENPWTHKSERYCHNAGLLRNLEMAKYANALIAIQTEPTPGTQHMIKVAKQQNISVYVQEREDKDYEYKF